MAIKRLTVAYRSRSRPSSTLGAKASTVCPYYLDGDRIVTERDDPGDTRLLNWPTVQFSRSGERRVSRTRPLHPNRRRRARPVSQNSTACVRVPGAYLEKRALRPSPVDMLGGPERP